MIPFKGHLSFKQYIEGNKGFCTKRCQQWVCLWFQIYAGKSSVEVGLCSRVVLELMEGLEDHYTQIIIIPAHSCFWLQNSVNCCGTARTNCKGFPKALVKKRRRILWLQIKQTSLGSSLVWLEVCLPCIKQRQLNHVSSRNIIRKGLMLMYHVLHCSLITSST